MLPSPVSALPEVRDWVNRALRAAVASHPRGAVLDGRDIGTVVFPDAATVDPGDDLRVDAVSGTIENVTKGSRHDVAALPGHLMDMIVAGGLMPWLKQRIDRGEIGT